MSGEVNVGIWGKLTKLAIGLIVVGVLLLTLVPYGKVIKQNERMRKEVLRLQTLEEKAAEEQRQLKTSFDALRNDPKAVERLAREKLGYAKPGETVIRFEDARTNQPAAR